MHIPSQIWGKIWWWMLFSLDSSSISRFPLHFAEAHDDHNNPPRRFRAGESRVDEDEYETPFPQENVPVVKTRRHEISSPSDFSGLEVDPPANGDNYSDDEDKSP